MNFKQLLESISPETYAALKRAVELGKWPNGERLTTEQRELCLQAVIAYDMRNKPESERVGYIAPKAHTHCGGEGEVAGDEPQTLTWRN